MNFVNITLQRIISNRQFKHLKDYLLLNVTKKKHSIILIVTK